MKFLEQARIAAGFVPVDMQTATAADRTGDWVSLENFNRIAVVLYKAAGTADDDVTLTIEQAQDAAGTGAKALDFTEVAVKQGSDLAAVGRWTAVTQAAGNTYTDADSAEAQAIWVVEFPADRLDAGFTFVRGSVGDVGSNAQLGCVLYVLTDLRFAGPVADVPSALA